MQVQEARDAFSKTEVAQRLGVGYVTLHRMIKAGELRTVRVGARVLIPKTELERFLEGK